MKNTIAIITLSVAAAYSSFAQGEVILQNTVHQQISGNSAVGGPSTGVLAFSGNVSVYYYALFDSVSATTVAGSGSTTVIPTAPGTPGSYVFSDNNWTFDAYASSSTSAGKFAATAPDSNGDTVIPGTPTAAQFVVVGWSGNIGSTVAAVEAWLNPATTSGVTGWIGESAVSGLFSTGNGSPGSSSPPSAVVSGSAPGLSAWTLGEYTPVPEPSSIALGVMGAASLLALRRKKA
jgi:hypothetical protein